MLFLFFFIIELYLSISAVIAEIFNPTAELAAPTKVPTNEPKAETETHPVIAETKISHWSM